jgi:hypothetical protein
MRDPKGRIHPLLLHASGVGSWSWKYNVAELSAHYRCFAVDLIGDLGQSEYISLDHVMKTGRDQAELYAGATASVIRITFAQLFPLRPIQESTFSWAFSDHPRLKAELRSA